MPRKIYLGTPVLETEFPERQTFLGVVVIPNISNNMDYRRQRWERLN